ncbi:zinc finger, CCHC-type containing protein [Tanacetum coccineum]
MGNVLDSCNQGSTQQCMKSRVAKHLGVAWIQQQNGLVEEINVTLLAKVRCFLIQSSLSKVFWTEDTTISTYLVNRSPSSVIEFKMPIDVLGFFGWLASIKEGILEPVKVKCIFLRYYKGILGNKLWRLDDVTSKVVFYRNMGFNESGEYKKTFIGSGVVTGSVKVLQGVEFEVEPQEDHTFEVEPHGNVDQVAGSHEVQTQDLIYYHSARDREQHSAWELFCYKEDNNEVAFAVAEAEKIYAHESLTFIDIVACEVISMWKTRLKTYMDARSDVYVLSNGCKKSSDDINGYYWEYTPGIRVGHSILSLEVCLSRDCDVEKNGKWSYTYAVGSQVYQGVCTRPDMALVDVGMLDGFDHELQIHVQGCAGSMEAIMLHMMAFLTTKAEYMTLTEAARETVIMYTRGRKKADAEPTPSAHDPHDVEMIERLQQRIQELEFQQLQYRDHCYHPRRNDRDVDRDDRYRDDPIRSMGLKIKIPEFTGKAHPDDFIDWLSTVEQVFDVRDILDKLKVKLVAIKLRQHALLWWDHVTKRRRIEGKSKIET